MSINRRKNSYKMMSVMGGVFFLLVVINFIQLGNVKSGDRIPASITDKESDVDSVAKTIADSSVVKFDEKEIESLKMIMSDMNEISDQKEENYKDFLREVEAIKLKITPDKRAKSDFENFVSNVKKDVFATINKLQKNGKSLPEAFEMAYDEAIQEVEKNKSIMKKLFKREKFEEIDRFKSVVESVFFDLERDLKIDSKLLEISEEEIDVAEKLTKRVLADDYGVQMKEVEAVLDSFNITGKLHADYRKSKIRTNEILERIDGDLESDGSVEELLNNRLDKIDEIATVMLTPEQKSGRAVASSPRKIGREKTPKYNLLGKSLYWVPRIGVDYLKYEIKTETISQRIALSFKVFTIQAGPIIEFQRQDIVEMNIMGPADKRNIEVFKVGDDYFNHTKGLRYVFQCKLTATVKTSKTFAGRLTVVGIGGGGSVKKGTIATIYRTNAFQYIPIGLPNSFKPGKYVYMSDLGERKGRCNKRGYLQGCRKTRARDVIKICKEGFRYKVRKVVKRDLKSMLKGLSYSHDDMECWRRSHCSKWWRSMKRNNRRLGSYATYECSYKYSAKIRHKKGYYAKICKAVAPHGGLCSMWKKGLFSGNRWLRTPERMLKTPGYQELPCQEGLSCTVMRRGDFAKPWLAQCW